VLLFSGPIGRTGPVGQADSRAQLGTLPPNNAALDQMLRGDTLAATRPIPFIAEDAQKRFVRVTGPSSTTSGGGRKGFQGSYFRRSPGSRNGASTHSRASAKRESNWCWAAVSTGVRSNFTSKTRARSTQWPGGQCVQTGADRLLPPTPALELQRHRLPSTRPSFFF